MYSLSSNQWREVSPYLDQALDVPDEERGEWLASLREQNPALAALLQTLLNEHRALVQEGFLEGSTQLPVVVGLCGQTIGAYRLVSQIGQGGMGSVWLAQRSDGRFERKVAIKFLNIALVGRGGEERFKREGSILGRLAHPHIAELVDAGVSPMGQPYLILEYIEGDHIDRYCDEHKLDVESRVRLLLDVLEAVAHAHANLIVHRDLKPSNVLVRNDGEIKLLDFGIAKLLEGEGQDGTPTLLTVEAGRAMTPEYAAPEQVTGGTITTATDVYALGVLLYVLLTGQHPAGNGPHSPADLVKAIVDTPPARPSDIASRRMPNAELTTSNASRRATTPDKLSRLLRGDLDTIVAKALKKGPAERYPSVTPFIDDLRRHLKHEPITARPDTLAYRAGKFVRRNRTAVGLATLAVVATAAGIVGTLMQARTARIQRDFALHQLARAESINDLDDFLLADAAPSGKPFTVNELLGRAEHVIERQHANASSRAELLTSVGHKYVSQDEDGKARSVLEQAYQVSRGLSDPSPRAQASCALGVAFARSDLPRAEALIQEGLRELPQGRQFTLERVHCLLDGSGVARESGAAQEAVKRSQAARDLLAASPLRSEIMDLRVQMSLAESYRVAGQYREAIPAFERAAALMTALGRDDTETAGTMFNDWALALQLSGRPLEAEKLYRRAIDISRSGQSEDGVSPMLLNNYARTLLELGREAEAASYADRAYAKAKQSGNQVVVNQSLLLRGRIYREQGNLTRSEAMLSEVEPRLRMSLPAGHLAFAALGSDRSLLALARGDLPSALELANGAVTITEASIKADRGRDYYLGVILLTRSDIERQLGRLDVAGTDAARALSILQQSAEPGTLSCYLGHAYYTLGLALRAEGKPEEARAAFLSAVQHLQSTLGPDHSDTRSARRWAEAETAHQ